MESPKEHNVPRELADERAVARHAEHVGPAREERERRGEGEPGRVRESHLVMWWHCDRGDYLRRESLSAVFF